jgi:hypothetical protein
MAVSRRIRVVIGGMAGAAALLVLPSLASAVVYCVPNDTIDPGCDAGQGQATIQAALTAAEGTSTVADTVHIDAGSYSESGLTYFSTDPANTVIVEGEGSAQTLITMSTTGLVNGLSVTASAGSVVRDLAMTIPANSDSVDRGINLLGSVAGRSLLVDGPSASNAVGIRLSNNAFAEDSTVDLPFAIVSNNALLSNGATSTNTHLNLHADTGIAHSGNATLTVNRSTIEPSFAGATVQSGTVTLRNSLIDLGTNDFATGVQAVNSAQSTLPIAATIDGDTIVGGGDSSTGIQARADSDATDPINEPGDTNTDGESSTVTVSNTILSGQTRSLKVEADRGETATVTTSYSNYNSAAKLVTSDLNPGGGTGTATLSESHQTNLPPGFVSASDFHLASGSALIDVGDPAGPPLGDQDIDGDDREIFGKDGCNGPRRDIGADEFVPLSPPTLLDCSPPATTSPPDSSAPDTFVSGKAKVKTRKKKARVTFTLTSTEPGSFECSLDGGPFAPCASPFSVKLRRGRHTLMARATDVAGNTDQSPASFTTKVKRKKKRR